MPVFADTLPMGFPEYHYLSDAKEVIALTKERPMLTEPQIYRERVAEVQNVQASLKITENTVIIPNVTKG